MSKRIARACISMGCRATMLLALAERRGRRRLVILCYHRVLPADQKAAYFNPELVVTPESFRRQCTTLKKHYEVLPLRRAVERWRREEHNGRPAAAITFDDGYRDNFRYARPILAEAGLCATFFVIAGLVGTERSPWYDRLGRAVETLNRNCRTPDVVARWLRPDRLGPAQSDRASEVSPRQLVAQAKSLPPSQRRELVEACCAEGGIEDAACPDDLIMSWEQLSELTRDGHEIGSHTYTHEILPQLDQVALTAEVAESKSALERGIGASVDSFCYPNGDYDDRVVRAVEAAGYHRAVTVEAGANASGHDVFRLARRFIHEDHLIGATGSASTTLLRMELCDLADRVFLRDPRRGRRDT